MAYGLPLLAAVNPSGEVARIVDESGAGWVVDSSQPNAFPLELMHLARAGKEVRERAEAARRYAEEHYTQTGFAQRFEQTLLSVASTQPSVRPAR